MDPEAMCATINDNERMQEKCDEFGEYLLKFLANEQEKELFREVLVSLHTYIHTYIHTFFSTTRLCKYIYAYIHITVIAFPTWVNYFELIYIV